jgi:hypothetical protein
MQSSLEIIDYGDAINETKQSSPMAMVIDNAMQFGMWY